MIYYKIVEEDSKGNYKMLFHGINKSRIFPKGVWVKAEKKWVRDGTSKTYYWSGWHVLKTYEECAEYFSRFKAPRKLVIIPCEVKGEIREKEHSPSNVYLAEYIKII